MPTISEFYGITVRMYWNDYLPAHFHVLYGADEASVSLGDLSIIRGSFPSEL
jgi:hypothetical protein